MRRNTLHFVGLLAWAFCVLLAFLGPLGWFVLGLLMILAGPVWVAAGILMVAYAGVRDVFDERTR